MFDHPIKPASVPPTNATSQPAAAPTSTPAAQAPVGFVPAHTSPTSSPPNAMKSNHALSSLFGFMTDRGGVPQTGAGLPNTLRGAPATNKPQKPDAGPISMAVGRGPTDSAPAQAPSNLAGRQALGRPPIPQVGPGDPPEVQASDPTGILDRIQVTGAGPDTRRGEGQQTNDGIQASDNIAQGDLNRVLNSHDLRAKFEQVGAKFGIPPALLAGIASRESHGGSALAQDGTGDQGNAFGMMQVDLRYHPDTPRDDPYGLAHMQAAAQIFRDTLNALTKQYPQATQEQLLLLATSKYNGGDGTPENPDGNNHLTTHGDYGNDTVERAKYYSHHWNEQSSPS